MQYTQFLFTAALALASLPAHAIENDFVDAPAQILKTTPAPDPESVPRPGETQDDVDKRLGPWLDLKGGGIAIGAPQGKAPNFGTLENGSLLPAKGDGFIRNDEIAESWGTGFMISLLEDSGSEHAREYGGEPLRIDSIALQFGGFNAGHKSHENGLDADVLYMGMLHPASVLDKDGHVMTNVFIPQKNWDYWRSIVGQRYAKNGRVQSIVGMILVDPRIKTFLCDWAKTNNMLGDPLNQAVMTRLYPTAGHDDHFHVRLLCSPYHTQCTGEFTPSKLGCD